MINILIGIVIGTPVGFVLCSMLTIGKLSDEAETPIPREYDEFGLW